MPKTTRTAVITTGIHLVAVAINTLFGTSLASKGENFRDVTIENQGNLDIMVASMEKNAAAPAAADLIMIRAGESDSFDHITAAYFFVGLATPILGDPIAPSYYQIKFIGTPE